MPPHLFISPAGGVEWYILPQFSRYLAEASILELPYRLLLCLPSQSRVRLYQLPSVKDAHIPDTASADGIAQGKPFCHCSSCEALSLAGIAHAGIISPCHNMDS